MMFELQIILTILSQVKCPCNIVASSTNFDTAVEMSDVFSFRRSKKVTNRAPAGLTHSYDNTRAKDDHDASY